MLISGDHKAAVSGQWMPVEEEGGHFSGFSGLSGPGKKLLLADLAALGASSIRREGGQATYAAQMIRKKKETNQNKPNKKTKWRKTEQSIRREGSQRRMLVMRWVGRTNKHISLSLNLSITSLPHISSSNQIEGQLSLKKANKGTNLKYLEMQNQIWHS